MRCRFTVTFKPTMRCRKKVNDALSVRKLASDRD